MCMVSQFYAMHIRVGLLKAEDAEIDSTYTRMAYHSRGDAWIFMTMGTTHCTNMKIQALLLEW